MPIRRALERAPWEDKVDPLEGVIVHGPIGDAAETR
jgi:hypothetical protein